MTPFDKVSAGLFVNIPGRLGLALRMRPGRCSGLKCPLSVYVSRIFKSFEPKEL